MNKTLKKLLKQGWVLSFCDDEVEGLPGRLSGNNFMWKDKSIVNMNTGAKVPSSIFRQLMGGYKVKFLKKDNKNKVIGVFQSQTEKYKDDKKYRDNDGEIINREKRRSAQKRQNKINKLLSNMSLEQIEKMNGKLENLKLQTIEA